MAIKQKDLFNYLENHKGEVIGVSQWQEITQDLINQFATLTKDTHPIHVSPVAAQKHAFGSTIAHGFLTLSLLSDFARQALPQIEGMGVSINYGFDEIRFLHPVKCSNSIRAKFILQDYTVRLSQSVLFKYEVTIEIKGLKKPGLRALWLVLLHPLIR